MVSRAEQTSYKKVSLAKTSLIYSNSVLFNKNNYVFFTKFS